MTKLATFKAHPLFGTKLTLYPDHITNGKETYPIKGVAAEIESFTGALHSGHGSNLLITGPDFAWTFTVESVKSSQAHKFAAAVNLAVRQSER
jgi:hypothetical protein